jgi:hypothetical protein
VLVGLNSPDNPNSPEKERVTGLALRLLVGAAVIIPACARHLIEHSFDIIYFELIFLLE